MSLIIFFSIIITILAYSLGLGAIIIWSLINLLATKSNYWSRISIAMYKPVSYLRWVGIVLTFLGSILFFFRTDYNFLSFIQFVLYIFLIFNGFLMGNNIQENLPAKLMTPKVLSKDLQSKIITTLVIELFIWCSSLTIFAYQLYILF